MSLYSTRRKPTRQPEAVAAGFEGKRNPGDRAPGPDRLIPPAMQQANQPFWARLELLARLTLNPGKHAALHYLDGFGERFERAAAAAEALFQALRRQPGCEVRRPGSGTNVTRLRVFGADAEGLPERLLACGIAIRPALHASPEGAEFELFTNETILRRPANEIVEMFIEALES